MRNRPWGGLVFAAALVIGLAGCGQEAAAPSGEEAAPAEETADILPPTEAAPVSSVPSDTFVYLVIGEPETLDPAWTYETTGAGLEANIYDSLVYFDQGSPDSFVPALAESWETSDDGLTYSFKIREGVSFHEGGTLTAGDLAYSIQRAMLQDRTEGPMWLFLEPMLGTSSIASLAIEQAGLEGEGDAAPKLADVPAETLAAVCEQVKAAVSADDATGMLSIKVLRPTPWLMQLMAQPWAAGLDMEWMAEQGDWDGDCATWQQWHDPQKQETALFDRANGTGPYKLGQWKKGQEITLEANEAYWRSEPIWEGGPSGPPAIKHVVLQKVDEWGTRFAKLTAGEADAIIVPRANIDQMEDLIHTEFAGGDESAPSELRNEAGTLKLFKGYPTASADAISFIFDVSPDSTFIGSGQLDGQGIPPNFFSDLNVRRGFSYCFNWETFIQDGLMGEGFQSRGPIIQGLLGYSEDSEIFSYDPEQCAAALEQAWDGQVAANGFQMTVAYNQGNDTRRTAAEILAEELALVDERYKVSVQELEWGAFLEARRAGQLPLAISGWLEDYHDASNWVGPYMHSEGAYARAQKFPTEMQANFDALIDQGLAETDPAAREAIYTELQGLANSEAISVWLAQQTGRFYVTRQTSGWFANPLRPDLWYYALSKE